MTLLHNYYSIEKGRAHGLHIRQWTVMGYQPTFTHEPLASHSHDATQVISLSDKTNIELMCLGTCLVLPFLELHVILW